MAQSSAYSVLQLAYARSSGNRAASLIAEGTEGVAIVNRVQRACFAVAARINPIFFGVQATVAYATGWARPAAAELIYWIEDANGAEVRIVPYEERTTDTGTGRIYQLGQRYQPCGGTAVPTGGNLTMHYSAQPANILRVEDLLDAAWPDNFTPLIVDEVALHLALKDRRMDELNDLRRSRDSWLKLYVSFLEHEGGVRTQRFQPMLSNQAAFSIIKSLFIQEDVAQDA